MQKEAEKFLDSSLMEGMFSIRAILRAYEDGINDRKIQTILFDKAKIRSKAKELSFLRAMSYKHGFEIEYVDAEKIDEMTIGSSHGGIIAICSERTVPSAKDMTIKENGFYVMLEGIEDPYNFGYCLRSLYAAGVDGILVGERNWFSAAGVVCRASAGASELFEIAAGDTAIPLSPPIKQMMPFPFTIPRSNPPFFSLSAEKKEESQKRFFRNVIRSYVWITADASVPLFPRLRQHRSLPLKYTDKTVGKAKPYDTRIYQ